jgi:sirohydrochlorin cobaltochelatase
VVDPARQTGLLICAHGVAGRPGAATRHAHAISARRRFAGVCACCLTGSPSVGEALEKLPRGAVVLVPLLMAEGYAWKRLLPRAVAAARDAERLIVRRPIGRHPGLAAVIERAAIEACTARRWQTGATTLLLVGHGTGRDPHSGKSLEAQALAIACTRRFAEVVPAFLEQPTRLGEALAALANQRAVVVGLFADAGVHGEDDVRAAIEPMRARVHYAGPVGILSDIADLIVDQALGADPARTLA